MLCGFLEWQIGSLATNENLKWYPREAFMPCSFVLGDICRGHCDIMMVHSQYMDSVTCKQLVTQSYQSSNWILDNILNNMVSHHPQLCTLNEDCTLHKAGHVGWMGVVAEWGWMGLKFYPFSGARLNGTEWMGRGYYSAPFSHFCTHSYINVLT